MMSSVDLSTTQTETRALDHLNSLQCSDLRSGMQRMRTFRAKGLKAAERNGSNLTDKSKIPLFSSSQSMKRRSNNFTGSLSATGSNAGGRNLVAQTDSVEITEQQTFHLVRYLRVAEYKTTGDSAEASNQGATNMTAEKLRMSRALRSQLALKEGVLNLGVTGCRLHYYRIMDGDMARVQLGATKQRILQKNRTAIMVQVNQRPEELLRLFLY